MHPVAGVPREYLVAVSVVGGLIGSLLLLWTPSRAFDFILPWLMLLATLALAFGQQAGAVLRRYVHIGPSVMLAGQFVLGIYGGYYGGAIGLMMLALWALMGEVDIKSLNPPRIMLASASNVAAVATFVIAGAVRWPQTLIMLVAGVIGGYGGARLGRVLPGPVIRVLTIICAAGITVAFLCGHTRRRSACYKSISQASEEPLDPMRHNRGARALPPRGESPLLNQTDQRCSKGREETLDAARSA